MVKRFAALAATVLLFFCLCGCADTDGALAAFPALAERAAVLNEYIWGSGAPVVAYTPSIANTSQYVRVSDDSAYKTLTELSEAILQVYSTDYCKIIFEIVLEGSDDAFARYNEDSTDGRLTRDVSNAGFTLRTALDPKGAKVKSVGFNRVLLMVPTTFDGAPYEDYEISLVYENGEWKLDSPTY